MRRLGRSTGLRRGSSSRASPPFDPSTLDGLVTALRSPAVNVRAIGFNGLKARGAGAVSHVAALLDDSNAYIRGRAMFLLYQLGPEGQRRAGDPRTQADPAMRIAAYRAMRRAGLDVMPVATVLARDNDPGVRREVALSMRDRTGAVALPVLVDVARRFDGTDRSYLEALGTGATGKEAALYDELRRDVGAGDPLAWSDAFAWIAWRLHPPTAVDALARRAGATGLPLEQRRRAMDALAFIDTRAASAEMIALAASKGPLQDAATWWVLNRLSNDWADHDLLPALKQRRIYDPDTLTLQSIEVPARDPSTPVITVAEVAALEGNAARGKDAFTRCLMCHALGGVGAEVGPALDGWTGGKSARGHRHGHRRTRRRDRARVRGHDHQDEGRTHDPGPAHQGG